MRRPLFLLLLAYLSMSPDAAHSETHWGIEAGANRSSLQHRTMKRPGEEQSPRLLPAAGVLLECPMGANWSLSPAIRYVQQGTKTTWHDQTSSGREDVIQHTLGGGVGVHLMLPFSLFLSVDPEVTYLLGGTLKGRREDPNGVVIFEDDVAADSDRWNVTIRAGGGKAWRMGGGIAMLSVRYVGGINEMTRIVPSHLTGNQRNIAWTGAGDPPYVSEWKTRGLELMAGFLW
jgi:hypothetical protein